MDFLFAAAVLATFGMSLVLCVNAWIHLRSARAEHEPEILLCAGLIAAGCIGVGLPHLSMALELLLVGGLFALPFTACMGVLWRMPAALRAERHRIPWGGFRVACAAVGIVTALSMLLADFATAMPPSVEQTPVFDVAFAIGTLCLGFGLGPLPGAIRSARDASVSLRFSVLCLAYAVAPLVAFIAAHQQLGREFGLPADLRSAEAPTSPLIRGLLVCVVGGLALVFALWARRMSLLDLESDGDGDGDAVHDGSDSARTRDGL